MKLVERKSDSFATVFLLGTLLLLMGMGGFSPDNVYAVHCGDGYFDAAGGEECDDGNLVNGDGCSSFCTIEPFCGDDYVDSGEGCDDGNNIDGDGCSAQCTVESYCGNGVLDYGETCDDGNNVDGDGCSSACTIEPYCGDGYLDPGEQCDDGNFVDGDGCSAKCEREVADQGCTPGYWKQPHHSDSWMGYQPDMLFSAVFADAFPGLTLLDVLQQGGGGLKSLGRHSVAALLNSSSTDIGFNLTASEVIGMFNSAYASGDSSMIEDLKNAFNSFNEQGCPLN